MSLIKPPALVIAEAAAIKADGCVPQLAGRQPGVGGMVSG